MTARHRLPRYLSGLNGKPGTTLLPLSSLSAEVIDGMLEVLVLLTVLVSTDTRILAKVDPSALGGGAKRAAALGYA